MVPKHILQDKEALYDNSQQLKQYANELLEENQRLKARMQQMEEEVAHRTQIINSLMVQMGNGSNAQGIQKMRKEVNQ